MLSSAVEKAQMKIESNNYGIRKNLLDYDAVMNDQREIIYEERRKVLDGESMRPVIMNDRRYIKREAVNNVINESQPVEEWDLDELNVVLAPIVPLEPMSTDPKDYDGYTKDKLIAQVTEKRLPIMRLRKKNSLNLSICVNWNGLCF